MTKGVHVSEQRHTNEPHRESSGEAGEGIGPIFRRFARRLLAFARKKLGRGVRRKVDEEDIIQSVFTTLAEIRSKKRPDLETSDELWGLLARLTQRKCVKYRRRFYAQRRDVRREQLAGAYPDERHYEFQVDQPLPDETVAAQDAIEFVTRGLDETQRGICLLRLAGFSIQEIGDKMGCSERTVYRVLALVRERLDAEDAGGMADDERR
ncbi:MAG: sigma-70 family RNA polymerase sigma factor [Thermogutta sp.]